MASTNFDKEITNNAFVFVVCGGAEHIDTLNFSIKELKKNTDSSIVVVTELKRNEKTIQHDHIISVNTPNIFDHHQASIFLKTSLHKILPKDRRYCYLDTDVICLSKRANSVFENFLSPIIFAPDHCDISQFSPSAINCGCMNQQQQRIAAEEIDMKNKIEMFKINDEVALQKEKKLLSYLEEVKNKKLYYRFISLKFNLSKNVFKLKDDCYYDKQNLYWFDSNNKPIHYDSEQAFLNLLKSKTGVYWELDAGRWNKKGNNIYEDKGCDHLVEEIKDDFDIEIKNKNWTHWNGGVFLFDDTSHQFMDSWLNKTLAIFKDSRWKTRDQGTLAATAWEFGMQNHPTLSKDFNFLADYNNPYLRLSEDGASISDNNFKTSYQPSLIHIFHHFGDKSWYLWQWLEKKLVEKN